MNELTRQRDEHDGPNHPPDGGIGWLDGEFGLQAVIVDGQVDLVSLARIALSAISETST